MRKYTPWIINLELTNLCNLECVFCDHPILKKQMELGYMGDQTLEKILKDVESMNLDAPLHELGLVGLGEPTMDKRLPEHLEIIDEYKEHFNRISLNSNLVAMREVRIELLLNSPVNVYTFSVNSSNKSAYKNAMGRDVFKAVVSNLKLFLQKREALDNHSEVHIQVFESNYSGLDELMTYFPGEYDEKVKFFSRKVYTKPVIENGSEQVNIFKPERDIRHPCWDIYTRVYIDRQGFLYPCTIGNDSYRKDSNLCIGNVLEDSVGTLFNNDLLKSARERAELGELPFPECEKCNIWALTPNNFTWNPDESRWIQKKMVVRAYRLHEEVGA